MTKFSVHNDFDVGDKFMHMTRHLLMIIIGTTTWLEKFYGDVQEELCYCNAISECISDNIPPQMIILNMVIPILMHLFSYLKVFLVIRRAISLYETFIYFVEIMTRGAVHIQQRHIDRSYFPSVYLK